MVSASDPHLLLVFEEDWRVEVRNVGLGDLEHEVVLAGVGHVAQGDHMLGRAVVLQGEIISIT